MQRAPNPVESFELVLEYADDLSHKQRSRLATQVTRHGLSHRASVEAFCAAAALSLVDGVVAVYINHIRTAPAGVWQGGKRIE